MSENFADRLAGAVARKGSPVCVGIDPSYSKLPDELKPLPPVQGIEVFALAVIEAVAEHVPAVKPQIAYFERYGSAGVAAYERTVRAARQAGLLVIGDVKRGDIGSTAAEYAAGHLAGPDAPDAVTVNSYFGDDGIEPFADEAARTGRGVFVLVRTSNPSAAALQDFADADGRRLYEHVAAMVARLGDRPGRMGALGYSCVGAVVGATYPEQARQLRKLMPHQVFLVPGYGAQGASARDCAAAFDDAGGGAVVNASRSVIYAYAQEAYRGRPWRQAIADAARDFAREIAYAVRVR